MECKQCGVAQSNNARFCSECGAMLEHEPPKEGDLVNVRGTVIRAGTVNMGAPQNSSADPVECIICGSFNEVKDTFRCKKCGRTHLCREHRDKITYLCEECERDRKASDEKALQEIAKSERRAAQAASQKAAVAAATSKAELHEMVITLPGGVKMEFVRVPAGKFTMGSNGDSDEQPVHEVYLDEYWMGKYPVTNGQYAAFVKSFGWHAPEHWEDGQIPAGKENHPVTYVRWQDAAAFCEWAGLQTRQPLGLPTEAQWEKAARGTDGRKYPWGNKDPNALLCNFAQTAEDTTTTPVGKYSPQGDSPFGCTDMAGNVWEWCSDWYDADYYSKSPKSNPTGPAKGEYRVLRGGNWENNGNFIRCSVRIRDTRDDWDEYNLGFRCARSSP